MRVHSAASVSFRHQLKDLHQAIAVRRSEHELPIFEEFSDLKEFRSVDVCSLHVDAEL